MKIKSFAIALMIFVLFICSIGISAFDVKQRDLSIKEFVTVF